MDSRPWEALEGWVKLCRAARRYRGMSRTQIWYSQESSKCAVIIVSYPKLIWV